MLAPRALAAEHRHWPSLAVLQPLQRIWSSHERLDSRVLSPEFREERRGEAAEGRFSTAMSSSASAEDAEMQSSAGSARPDRERSREPSLSPSFAGSSLQTSTVGRTESTMTVNSLSDFGSMLEPHADGFIRVSSGLYLHGSSATLQEQGFVKEGLNEIHDFKPLGFSLTCDAEVLVFSRVCLCA